MQYLCYICQRNMDWSSFGHFRIYILTAVLYILIYILYISTDTKSSIYLQVVLSRLKLNKHYHITWIQKCFITCHCTDISGSSERFSQRRDVVRWRSRTKCQVRTQWSRIHKPFQPLHRIMLLWATTKLGLPRQPTYLPPSLARFVL